MVCLLCVSCSSAISSTLDLSLRTLEGDHIRPMAQALVDLPPEVANVANQAAATGGILLGRCVAGMGSVITLQRQCHVSWHGDNCVDCFLWPEGCWCYDVMGPHGQ